jgi:translation elongation factor P/translation initiation factor 5A
MDSRTFEEIRVPKADTSKSQFLTPGLEVTLVKFKDKIIDVALPHTAEYTVQSIDQSIRT